MVFFLARGNATDRERMDQKSGAFDEVIDFDELTRDPKDPQRLKAEYSDDWLHLNPKGYEAMGKFAAEKLK